MKKTNKTNNTEVTTTTTTKKETKKMIRKPVSKERREMNGMLNAVRKQLNALLKTIKDSENKNDYIEDVSNIFAEASNSLNAMMTRISIRESISKMTDNEKEMLKQMLGMND